MEDDEVNIVRRENKKLVELLDTHRKAFEMAMKEYSEYVFNVSSWNDTLDIDELREKIYMKILFKKED